MGKRGGDRRGSGGQGGPRDGSGATGKRVRSRGRFGRKRGVRVNFDPASRTDPGLRGGGRDLRDLDWGFQPGTSGWYYYDMGGFDELDPGLLPGPSRGHDDTGAGGLVPPAQALDFAALILEVYQLRAPDKLGLVPGLLSKFGGGEHALYLSVCREYGHTPIADYRCRARCA